MNNNFGDMESEQITITEPSITEIEKDEDKIEEPLLQDEVVIAERQEVTDPDMSQTENDTYLTTRNSVMIETLMLKKNMIKKICQQERVDIDLRKLDEMTISNLSVTEFKELISRKKQNPGSKEEGLIWKYLNVQVQDSSPLGNIFGMTGQPTGSPNFFTGRNLDFKEINLESPQQEEFKQNPSIEIKNGGRDKQIIRDQFEQSRSQAESIAADEEDDIEIVPQQTAHQIDLAPIQGGTISSSNQLDSQSIDAAENKFVRKVTQQEKEIVDKFHDQAQSLGESMSDFDQEKTIIIDKESIDGKLFKMTAGSQDNNSNRKTISPIGLKKPIDPSHDTNVGDLINSPEFHQRVEINQEIRQIAPSVAQITIEKQTERSIKVNDIGMDITDEDEKQVLNRTIEETRIFEEKKKQYEGSKKSNPEAQKILQDIGNALIDQLKDNPCTCIEGPKEPEHHHHHTEEEELSYKELINFISEFHPVNPVTKEKFDSGDRITVKDFGYKLSDACGCFTLAMKCKMCLKEYRKLHRGEKEKKFKPETMNDLPDSGSDSSELEDKYGFHGLTGAGAHLGIGAIIYLQSMYTFFILFFVLTVLNIPIYLMYYNVSFYKDALSLANFSIGAMGTEQDSCAFVQDGLMTLSCNQESQFISSIQTYGFMNGIDPRLQSLSSGEYQCSLINKKEPQMRVLRDEKLEELIEKLKDTLDDERLVHPNTEYNLDPACKSDSKNLFLDLNQRDEIQTFFKDNCIGKKTCEWSVPEFSQFCQDKINSDELILILGCRSDIVGFQGYTIHKKEAAYIIILFDIISTFTMMYFIKKLSILNDEYQDIVSDYQLSLTDFSVVCRNVILDKYTQEPIIIKMKIWLHFSKLLEPYKIAGNNQEIADVNLSLCSLPKQLKIFELETHQKEINYLKNLMSEGSSANFFIYQEQCRDAQDQFDSIVDKYKKIIEEEVEAKKFLGFVHKQDRIPQIDYIFVTLKNSESTKFAADVLVQEPGYSKFFRCLFCIKNVVQLKKEFLKVEMDVQRTFSPDEIIWENLRTNVNENAQAKFILQVINWITILFSAFFIMIIDSQREAREPDLLCPDFEITKAQAWQDEIGMVQKNLMKCYCHSLLTRKPWKLLFLSFIEVDPQELDTNNYCRAQNRRTIFNWLFTGVSYFSIITFNGIVAYLCKKTGEFQMKHLNFDQTKASFNQIFAAEQFNTGLVVVLVSLTGMNTLLVKYEDYQIPSTKRYMGFDTAWYLDMGEKINISILLSSFVSNYIDMRNYSKKSSEQLIDRKNRDSMKEFPDDEDDDQPNTKQVTQMNLNAMYEGEMFDSEKTLARMMSTIFVVIPYSSGMPIQYAIGLIFFYFTFKTNKTLLIKYYKRTDTVLTPKLPLQAVSYLRFCVLYKMFMGIVMITNPQVFETVEQPDFDWTIFDLFGIEMDIEEGSPMNYVKEFHQQTMILFVLATIGLYYTWQLVLELVSIMSSSIKSMIVVISMTIYKFSLMAMAQIRQCFVVISRCPKQLKRKMQNKQSKRSLQKTNSLESIEQPKEQPTPNSLNNSIVEEVDEVAAAAAKMKADEEAAYLAKIMKGRERGDYSDNFYMQMRMTSLEAFYFRACKELKDFQQFFRITPALRRFVTRKQVIGKPHPYRVQFLEKCFMNGVVEEEVLLYDNLLSQRIDDMISVINKHFKLVQPAITQSKTDRMNRDIEKTMGKPMFQQRLEQKMLRDRFNEDEDLKFDEYSIEKKLEKLIEHQDDLIKLDKTRIDNRLGRQTICKIIGSEAQTYFMYDCPRLKVAKQIYYQLEEEQANEYHEDQDESM